MSLDSPGTQDTTHYGRQRPLFSPIFGVFLLSVLATACSEWNTNSAIPPGHGSSLIKDKARYTAVSSMIVSYVDYPIFDVRLLLSEDQSTAFRDAIILPSVFPDNATANWVTKRASDGMGGDIAWDRTWPITKTYRIWWNRVVDPVAFASVNSYDRYTSRRSQPGTAWCEAIVVLNKPLPAIPGHFVLHFYPDGHIEADISAMHHDPSRDPPYRLLDTAESPRNAQHEVRSLQGLKGRPCIKEIPNPYFGEVRPIKMD